jgi:guanylate kinase
MSNVPILTKEERAQALQRAKESRKVRAAIKEQVRTGALSVIDVLKLSDNDPVIAKMRAIELLESVPGYGKIRASNLMEKFAISSTRRLQGLGRHQRLAIVKEFDIPHPHSRGSLLVLSGPGGVGKSTVAKALRGVDGFWVSVSATTRAPREGEEHGVDYLYCSQEEFDTAIANDQFLEWAEFAGNRYGTPRAAVEEALTHGLHVLLEIEITGAKQVRQKSEEAVLVFLEPPSWEELVARLEGRGTDSPERRALRLALAQEELAAASLFDAVVVNTRVDEVVQRLIELASAHQR